MLFSWYSNNIGNAFLLSTEFNPIRFDYVPEYKEIFQLNAVKSEKSNKWIKKTLLYAIMKCEIRIVNKEYNNK